MSFPTRWRRIDRGHAKASVIIRVLPIMEGEETIALLTGDRRTHFIIGNGLSDRLVRNTRQTCAEALFLSWKDSG